MQRTASGGVHQRREHRSVEVVREVQALERKRQRGVGDEEDTGGDGDAR